MKKTIAYFINQYPKVSHTFIRREILALERQGYSIQRIALRGWDAELVDVQDHSERDKTQYVLKDGVLPLLLAAARVFLNRPIRFMAALKLSLSMGRGAERSWPYHIVYLAEACRILPWLDVSGASHVHAHFSTNSTEVVMLANALGGPGYSFTVHGQVELTYSGLATKIRRSRFVVAISSFGRSQLFHKIEYPLWHKIKVVHCGLEPDFHKIPASPPPATRRMVCVARLSKEKGHFILIEAMNQLIRKGLDIQLVLAGDGELRAEIELLISKYDLTDFVRVTGWISSEQVRDEILASRCLVLPSFSEGLPVVIMEAMALRRPVLATYVGGIPELVVSGKHGVLFPAGSVEDLSKAIENMFSRSKDELVDIGDAAYLRVLERHSIDGESLKLAGYFTKFSH